MQMLEKGCKHISPLQRYLRSGNLFSSGMYKVDWDVSIDSTNKRMDTDIIVRDCVSQVSATKSKTIYVVQEPVVAEALATLSAPEFS